MKKASKGALAIGTAGFLLLGGAGSLAYWTDTATVTGSDLSSGHLKLINPSCGGWKLNGSVAYVPATNKIVPGDYVVQTCTYKVDALGDNITASFGVDAPAVTGNANLASALGTPQVSVKVNGTTVANTGVTVVNNDTITAAVRVDFNTGAGNNTEDVTTTLGNITLTATQGHS